MSKIDIKGNRVVDLSHVIEFGMPRAFGFPDIEKTWLHRIDSGSHVNVERVTTVLHAGTHVDAPAHFFLDGASVDQIAADALIGPAVVLDMRSKKGHAGMSKEDIIRWEAETGVTIQKGDAVIFWTDHSKTWHLNEDDPEFLKTWPYIEEEAAVYLKDKGIRFFGTEAGDIDDINKPLGPSHNVFLGNNIYVVEDLCNIDKIGANRCQIIAAPLNIKNGTGSQLRVLAVVDN